MLDQTITKTQKPNWLTRNWVVAVLLMLILAGGGYYRFVGLNWDDYTHLHPDERFLTQVLAAVGGNVSFGNQPDSAERFNTCLERYPADNGRGLYFNGGYFDASCSALNPNNVGYGLYVYGTLPLFIADIGSDRFADFVTAWETYRAEQRGIEPPATWENDVWRGYSGAHIVWRALNGFSDLLATFFLFLIGRRLHGKWVGLLAAALYIAAPLPIQKAHFATVNSMANLFGVLSLYFAVRIQDKGYWGDYAGFGLAFAAALASRINLVPLVLLAIVASGLRMLPVFDWRLAWGERSRIITREFGGLVLAGIITILAFRFFQPYAFAGPHFWSVDLGKLLQLDHTLGIFNETWLENIGQAQYLVSGQAESPPNWQWVSRMGYVFPFTNMVLWGMGAALGLTAWAGWLWGGVRIVRGVPNATRHLLPFIWVTVYFAWIGNLWVMSMRYYLPLYPALVLFGAWALVELHRISWKQGEMNRPIMRWGAVALIVAVLGFTQLWGLMFTNIYRNQLTRVQASHWIWENVPGDFAMQVEGAPSGTPLINIPLFNRAGSENDLVGQASLLEPGIDYVFNFTAPADGEIAEIQIPHLGVLTDDGETRQRIRASIHTVEGDGMLAQGILAGEFNREHHPIGDSYTISLETPITVNVGREYVLRVEVLTDQTLVISGAIVSNEGAWDDPVPAVVCQMPDGITLANDPPPGLNNAQNCNARNAYGNLVNGYTMALALDDIPLKRDTLQLALDNTDYIVISSNRFYDTVSRNPGRWPMTNAYYDALFRGELGFELAAVFEETFELGALRIPDQHLPTMNAPAWLNEFEAEEAFHVYDHPVVFVFRKVDEYSPQATQRVLYGESLVRTENVTIGLFNDPTIIGVNPLYSLPADETPTQLKLKPEDRELQYENGTWSERFNRNSLVNQQSVVTVLVWWLTIMLFGWVAFPLCFAMFPMLADRGYAVAKFAGLMAVAWFAWFATSLNLYLWNGTGLWLTLGLLVLLSGWVGWQERDQLNQYVRQHWKRLAVIELLTLTAFLFFLGVRLSNPDLWHPSFGGEKPMDFAYFNGVLRSTTFPPLDPWHAGGYINYYYFGFVLVGTPVLMLGIVPSVAYNLIIPTVFALTGMGAFAVAFNIVAGLNSRFMVADDENALLRPQHKMHLRGSAWTAGLAALLLAVVLGNLNQPRVFTNGLAQLGGYTPTTTMNDYLREQYINRYGVEPSGEALVDIVERATNPALTDQLGYQIQETFEGVTSVFNGAWLLISEGQRPNIPTNRWHWAATRILAEPPVSSGGAITEMPYFTFLYGDLHAHMISMPMQLFVLLFLLHEVFHAGRHERRTIPTVVLITLGAVVVGMLRGTNTWDWPTYLALSVLGLGYAWWLKFRSLSRKAIVDVLLRVGGFISLSIWLSLPYTRWYAAIYSSASLWEGNKTPIWAYLIIHGTFVFLILSLLIWETGRWLQSVKVRALRGKLPLVYTLLGMIAFVLILSMGLSIAGWRVSVLLIPMFVWSVILFFRPDQSREMQFVLVLAAVALAATLGVEYIVIDGDIGRQNTVFKFYLQAWLMFAVVGGVVIAWLLESCFEWRLAVRALWLTLLGMLVTVAALYPILATQARALERMAPEVGITLDGMAYMELAQHYEVTNSAIGEGQVLDLRYDYNVIRWLQDNVAGTPVIMEGQSESEYRWGSRMSIYTGLPSVIGWNFHQRQQRTFSPMPQMVQQRVANVNAFYTTPDLQTAANILQHYEVEYVIVSALERARYPDGIGKLFDMVEMGVLEVVYTEDDYAVIFKVNPLAAEQLALGQDITPLANDVARAN